MWGRILALVIKEFIALLKDKRSRVVLIGPPLIQLMIFGYAATFDLRNVPFAVYNEDRGAASRELLAAFDGSPTFGRVAQISREGEIAPLVDSKRALMVIHLGPHFSADLLSGRSAAMQVIVDGRNSNTAMLAVNNVRDIVDRFNREWASTHGGSLPPAYIETRAWFNPNLESRWFFLPGIVGLLTLLVTLLVTAFSVAREREQGTFDQLLVTPLRPVEILIGKTLPGFIIGLLEATIIILAAVFWFKVPLLGSLLTLYTGILLFLLSGVGVGLMISSFAVTQ
ncbi:MAG TPA: ABC transporter permease, partial [Sideroxyarcus sp.]|nr:ABC transporter permease [Sideroxyarcus sp.]